MPGVNHISLSSIPKVKNIWILASNNSKYNKQLLAFFLRFASLYPIDSYCPLIHQDDNLIFKVAEITRSHRSGSRSILYKYVDNIKSNLPYCFYEFVVGLNHPDLFANKYIDTILKLGRNKHKTEEFLIAYYISDL